MRSRRRRIALLFAATVVLSSAASAKVENHGPGDDWVEIHDATRAQHEASLVRWTPTHRVISLNLSGSPSQPRFASVWVRSDLYQIVTEATCCSEVEMIQRRAAFGPPVLITATGPSAADAKYAAVWEEDHDDLDTFLSLTTSELIAQKVAQIASGRTQRWLSVFGTARNPLYTAVFEPIPIPGTPADGDGLSLWTANVGQDLEEWRENRAAHNQQWVRAGVLAPAPNGTFATAGNHTQPAKSFSAVGETLRARRRSSAS